MHNKIRTIQELNAFSIILRELSLLPFKTTVAMQGIQRSIEDKYGAAFLSAFKHLLPAEVSLETMTYADFARQISTIQKALQTPRVFKLTLAFEPSDSFIDTIYAWSKKNLGEHVFLDIIWNPTIVAGALLSFDGIYADFSVLKKLNEYSEHK